ncbi:MAG: hypothetical protein HKL79_06655 [Thermoplasmata archaeon]|nr:hypothetical protein [Thermoplasmata archaeon]
MSVGAIVAIEGPSAAGKSAVSLAAGALSGGATLPEAYVRLGRRVPLEYRSSPELVRIERRLLREDVRRWRQARDLARQGRTVYLDTGVFGTLTYTWGLVELGRARPVALSAIGGSVDRALRSGRLGLPDRIAFIDTPPSVRRRRARQSPEGHPARLDELHARVGELERVLWSDRWGPLLGSRLVRIDGRESVARIARRLARIGSLPRTRTARTGGGSDRHLLLALLRSLPRSRGRDGGAASGQPLCGVSDLGAAPR